MDSTRKVYIMNLPKPSSLNISKFSLLVILMQLMFECMKYEKFCIDQN